ncbi:MULTISPECIES: DUF3592 domain-containing protein [unclassified Streptomyces]|uniref:DUF3592 domain-containing protein n=1 Tax=unclassified Streptomyces TaxID=2593676 RepID=UPI000360D6BB|nr:MULTISPECIES: DUF3592 domain-containing protein [unclassified Streptomyces]MYT32610.1 hypothetical protein [Streptomyces sp. SID8354]
MDTGAVAVLAGIAAFGGLLGMLAGVFGLRQVRRVQRTGVCVAALVKQPPGRASDGAGRPRPLLQFVTDDERVLEIVCPVAPTRRRPLADGDRVLLRYDPADPRTVVVQGREHLGLERAFVVGGAIVLLLSLLLMTVA